MTRRLSIAIAAAAIMAWSAPNAVGAVTIGSTLTAAAQTNGPCGAIDCTAMTLDAPLALQAPGGLRAPADGVVTSWRIRSGSAGNPVKLRILRPASGLSFTAVASSANQSTVTGISALFPTQLAVKAGDAIGVDNTSGGLIYEDIAGPTLLFWNPPLPDGSTQLGTTLAARGAQIQANIEPDLDCDGKGDESQDPNLTDGICKSLPTQTLTAKKRQKVAKASVSETLDKAGSVSLQAKVKIPAASPSSRTLRLFAKAVKSKKASATLAANTPTKIRIKFSAGVRKKIKNAIEDTGKPRKVVVTSVATDTFGNVSTKTVRFKLTG